MGNPRKELPKSPLPQAPKKGTHIEYPNYLASVAMPHAADDPYVLLAYAIVYQAVEDWRKLIDTCNVCKGYDDAQLTTAASLGGNKLTINNLRRFFKSQWCAELLFAFDNGSDDILNELECELFHARIRYQNNGLQ